MYRTLGDSIDVYTRDMDVHTETGAATVLAASAAFRANPYVADASVVFVDRGVQPYRGATARSPSPTSLFSFVSSASGASFYDDIVWVNETGTAPLEGIQVTRMRGNHIKADSSNEKVKSMDSLRASLASVAGNEEGIFSRFPPPGSTTSSTRPSRWRPFGTSAARWR